ncbi:MAG: carboxypeptidase-like regulatory domain-containing protein [Armatimonadetes bacterium]|nr:carboxypeptidase-like regulatory domain-containing protein [Armatimonadota bacterium]
MSRTWRMTTALASAAALAALWGCGGGGATSGSLQGFVKDAAGRPIAGCAVTALGATATTDGDGLYRLNDLPEASAVVTYRAAGYTPSVARVPVAVGQTSQWHPTLTAARPSSAEAAKGTIGAVHNRGDGTGAGISLSASALKTTAATVNVSVTAVMPSDAGFATSAPGSAAGPARTTLGRACLSITDPSGAAVALDASKTLSVTITLDAAGAAGLTSAGLYHLDAATGVWSLVGAANRAPTGFSFEGSAPAATGWYALAVPAATPLTVQALVVEEPSSMKPVIGATVRARSASGAVDVYAPTDAAGRAELVVPGGDYTVTATKLPPPYVYVQKGPLKKTTGSGTLQVTYWLQPQGGASGGN